MANNKQMATDILKAVGGKENVSSVTHCMTRLRFILKDESLSSDDAIKAIPGIITVVHAGGQVQIVVGTTVDKVYSEVCMIGNFDVQDKIDENMDIKKEKLTLKSILNNIMNSLSGSITPILPVFIAAGIFKMFVILLGPTNLNIMSETSDIYRLLSLAGDAGYYFLPMFAAYSAAKKFNCNPVLALLLAGIMIHPEMLKIVEDGSPFTVFGIPMKLVNYTQAVIPVILNTWVLSHVERFIGKVVPDMIRVLAIPVLTMTIMLPVGLCIFGPAISIFMGWIADLIIWLSGTVGILAMVLVGATWSLIIAFGMHVPILVALLPAALEIGFDPVVQPATIPTIFASLAVALAYAIRAKGKENKELGLTCFVTYLTANISEPYVYGIMLRDKKALAWHAIGGAIGAGVVGVLGAKIYIFSGVGFCFLNPLRYGPDVIKGSIGCAIAFIVSFALSMIFGFTGSEKSFKFLEKKKK